MTFELMPNANEKILLGLQKDCDADDQATWKVSFQLQEGNPLATVVSLAVDLDPEDFPKAQETVDFGQLDDGQLAAAQIAASVAKDSDSSDDDKRDAIQSVIAARETSGTGPR